MSSPLVRFKNFTPPGPVASAFLQDRQHMVRALLGPVGGGKSVTCIFDTLSNASLMPICTDGIIRFRIAIIGMTYGQIERNLYPTWKGWLPEDGGGWTESEWIGGGGRFATHRITFDVLRQGRRVPVEFEAIFAAIGENAIEAFMRGFEPTAFWLYEMDQLAEEVLTQAIFRLGRYPAQHMLKPGTDYRAYVVGDLNAPDIDSWFYNKFEIDLPPNHKLYKQPSGRSPMAENIKNLKPGYYAQQVATLSGQKNGRHLVKRMVDAQYAPSLDGLPVYADEYNDDVHLSPVPLEVLPKVPMQIGFDQGLTRPAAIIGQRAPNGQFRCYREVVPGRMNASRFAERVKLALLEVAPDNEVEIGWADPAGFDGADKEANDFAWAETVSAVLGMPILPAPSNEVGLRLQAVTDELTYMIAPNVPAIIIDRTGCPMLRKGFASHYRYANQRIGNTVTTSDRPEKGDYSNPHDALQYWLLGHKGRHGVVHNPAEGRRKRGTSGSASDGGSVKLNVNTNLF